MNRAISGTNPHKKLVKYLDLAQSKAKGQVVRSSDIDRTTREKLTTAGYLSKVINGWYLLSTPSGSGTTTLWLSNFWDFIREYLSDRFGQDYCLTAESSLDLHSGSNTISKQISVITKKATNENIELLHGTSILLYQDEKKFPLRTATIHGLTVLPLPESLCRVSPHYFLTQSLNVEICLRLVGSPSELSRVLLETSMAAAADRIVGAYKALDNTEFSNQIENDLTAAGYTIKAINPFAEKTHFYIPNTERVMSPYSGRISALWIKMREEVLQIFPEEPGMSDTLKTLNIIEQLYKDDSYNSLSIEGYRVTPDLIEKIQDGKWSPDSDPYDLQQKNAMAAFGYQSAFKSVVKSITRILNGASSGQIFYEDLQDWYRELFKPAVRAGILEPRHLAGYRNQPVYISGARHVPPPSHAVLDCMKTLEKLLIQENSAAVRAVLGHFIFVYIHPYMDGNGRIARFILNLMLVSGGYNWTVIRVTERARYMQSLETASVDGNIKPFAEFILSEMTYWKNMGAAKT